MTLIIGAISNEFSIIAGDTQSTVGSNIIGGKPKKEPALKIYSPQNNVIYGILGKWVNYYCDDEYPTKLHTIHYHHDRLVKIIKNSSNIKDDIFDFLSKCKTIDCTVLLIEQTNNMFRMLELTNKKPLNLSTLGIGNLTLAFNEPFAIDSPVDTNKMIESCILRINSKYNLKGTFVDALFLINNVLLEIICRGESIALKNDKGGNYKGILDNTVGGVVTIMFKTANQNILRNMSLVYDLDFSTLLDKTTNPFAYSIGARKSIRYVDNLSMILQNAIAMPNQTIKEALFDFLERQFQFVLNEDILKPFQVNGIVEYINTKYGLKLNFQEVKDEEILPTLDLILNDVNFENNAFFQRFF